MRPILLKGHERSLTYVCFNKDGDLLFSCSKDNRPTLWYSENGERVGTYEGHNGTVWGCDVSSDSSLLLTASADMSCKLFEVSTGVELWHLDTPGPCRWVQWAEGMKSFAVVMDPFQSNAAQIWIFDLPADGDARNISSEPRLKITDVGLKRQDRIIRAMWMPLNSELLIGCADGSLRQLDPQDGRVTKVHQLHTDQIQDIKFNSDKTLILTSSRDNNAKVSDASTFECLMTFETDRPINSAVFVPNKLHVITGGGQDAMSVTTTAGQSGKFEARFFHLVYGDLMGLVKGHFGPINTLAVHPDGHTYASGGEDGYIRLHHFDKSYLSTAPESDEICGTESAAKA